jgi:hypothetical protein
LEFGLQFVLLEPEVHELKHLVRGGIGVQEDFQQPQPELVEDDGVKIRRQRTLSEGLNGSVGMIAEASGLFAGLIGGERGQRHGSGATAQCRAAAERAGGAAEGGAEGHGGKG